MQFKSCSGTTVKTFYYVVSFSDISFVQMVLKLLPNLNSSNFQTIDSAKYDSHWSNLKIFFFNDKSFLLGLEVILRITKFYLCSTVLV